MHSSLSEGCAVKHFIFGGRFGDICHSLPAVYEYAQRTGTRPRFTAAKEFASILDGCSYIEPYAADVPWARIQDIIAYAKRMFPADDFQVMACYGIDYPMTYRCWSFLRDSWRLSSCPTPPESQPLVFDWRNSTRETILKRSLGIGESDKFVLVSLFGKSSPFNQPHLLLSDIQTARPDLKIVNISNVRAERVYDLIGLMEQATALVTIDTLHLHLSAAVPNLPLLALICDGPTRWNRSDWRPQQVFRCNYSQYADQRPLFRKAMQTLNETPKIHHVWSGYRGSPDIDRRCAVAQTSWHNEAKAAGNWAMLLVQDSFLTRKVEGLPYVRDLIEMAFKSCTQDLDIISISNADVGCVAGVTGQVIDAIRAHGCAYTHRHDVCGKQIDSPILSESDVANLQWYPGSDWFFMSKTWWIKHGDEMPDMVLGREFWDAVLRQIMKKHGTEEIHLSVWHEKHSSYWEQPGNRQNLPGNNHNRALATKFFAANKSDANDPYRNTWNIQPNTQKVNPSTNLLEPTRKPQSNLVFPIRLQFQRNNVFNPR